MGHASVVADPLGARTTSHPPLLFHSLVVTEHERHPGRTGTTAVASALMHGALVTAVLVVPLLFYDAAPDPPSLRAFFVTPLEIQPPPPPPPPPPAAAQAVARVATPVAPTSDAGFVAPIEIPSRIAPDLGIDLGAPGGVPGGVAGGVPGGVLGGIVGGLPQSAAPPPPTLAPVRVGGHIKRPVKLKDVAPEYPSLAREARVQGIVILECTISPRGAVTDVHVLRGIPLLDAPAVEAVRQWVYTPTLLNGVPVPVVMTVTVTFQLH